MEDIGALALEPAEAPPQRRLDLALHRVRLVAGHPPPPLHLRVAEAPHVGPSTAPPAAAPHASLPPPRRRWQREARRRGKRPGLRRVDLDLPVASAGESAVFRGGGEVAVGVGGDGGEVVIAVEDGGVRGGGRRGPEVALVGAVVVGHGEEEEGGGGGEGGGNGMLGGIRDIGVSLLFGG